MIDILQIPEQCAFSKNSIDFKIQGNGKFDAHKVLPYLNLNFKALIPNGEIMSFSFIRPDTSQKVDIALQFSGDYSTPYVLPSSDFAFTIADYNQEILDRLKSIPELSSWFDFNLNVTGTTTLRYHVQIIAKFPWESLIITDFDSSLSGVQMAPTVYEQFHNPLEILGYQLQAVVHFEREYLSNDFTPLDALNLYSDADGIAELDVSNVLHAELEYAMSNFPLPQENADWFHFPELMKRYRVEFIELWNGQSIKSNVVTDVLHCRWGGVTAYDFKLGSIIQLLKVNEQFLTWWPSGKQLYKDQKDWLTWMNIGEQISIHFCLRVYKNTGMVEYVGPTHVLSKWETITRRAGYLQNEINALLGPGESCNKWSFIIKSGVKYISKEQVYYLNQKTCTYREIAVFNSFGLPETFSLVDLEETQEVSSELAYQSSLFETNPLKGDTFTFNSKFIEAYSGITGYLEKEEARRFKALLNSMQGFIFLENRWIPVVFTGERKKVATDSIFTRQIEVEFMVSYENDRSSFLEAQPVLKAVIENGIQYLELVDNRILIEDYGVLQITGPDSFITSAEWNNTLGKYELSDPILVSGFYQVDGECQTPDGTIYQLYLPIEYSVPIVYAGYDFEGTLEFTFIGESLSNTIDVDWGTGEGWQAISFTNGLGTYITKSSTESGNKMIAFRANSFDLIRGFRSLNAELNNFSPLAFRKLKLLDIHNANWLGELSLVGLVELENLKLQDVPISSLRLGIMPNLETAEIINSEFASNDVDMFLEELWNNRKHLNGSLEVTFSGLGFSASALALTIINGTGGYTGEGLNSDYGIVISIS